MVINGLPGSGRKCTSLVRQDVWGISDLITGDTHVSLVALAWKFADPTTSDLCPDTISRMIEDWMPNERYREMNSTSAGLRQLYSYEGDAERRGQARAVIERLAEEREFTVEMDKLLHAKVKDFFP